MQAAQLGEEEPAQEKSLESGSVSIGATETVMHGLLLRSLPEAQRFYPILLNEPIPQHHISPIQENGRSRNTAARRLIEYLL